MEGLFMKMAFIIKENSKMINKMEKGRFFGEMANI